MEQKTRRIIRERYKTFLPMIFRDYPRFYPYIFNWVNIFTPIEMNVWSDIRYLGLPMLPQFPVAEFFIDFADPIKKIGIEVDGKHHLQKIQEDKLRQEKLENFGWMIFRIWGWQTFKTGDDYFSDDFYDLEEHEKNELINEYKKYCSEGILHTLKRNFYYDTL